MYRIKRAVQTDSEKLQYDHRRVVLLETLGNARMDSSYDIIISHINTTNSPWIKRSGVHALRKYDHQMVCSKAIVYHRRLPGNENYLIYILNRGFEPRSGQTKDYEILI